MSSRAQKCPLDNVPSEILEEISVYVALPTKAESNRYDCDADFRNFALAYPRRVLPVLQEKMFWATLWRSSYDSSGITEDTPNEAWKKKYQDRRKYLHETHSFTDGEGPDRIRLGALRDLLLEVSPCSEGSSLNLAAYKDYTIRTNILETCAMRGINSSESTNLIHAIHVMLGREIFQNAMSCNTNIMSIDSHWNHVRLSAYNVGFMQPLFDRYEPKVNFGALVNVLNFFTFYKSRAIVETAGYFNAWRSLTDTKIPQSRIIPLSYGVGELQDRWNFSYGYGYEYAGDTEYDILAPEFGDTFPELNFTDFFPCKDASAGEEACVPSVPQYWPNSEALREESLRFQAMGFDDDGGFAATGVMNPLPPKMKVPGWKRFAMQQHDIQSFAPVRTYEGVLIPEGKLILGRWKDPHPLMPARTSMRRGPFIAWASN